MKLILILSLFLSINVYSQNCDSLIIIHSTVHDDENIYPESFEIDSLQNGLIVSRNIDTIRIEYRYDSLSRLICILQLPDSTIFTYDSNSRIIFIDKYRKNIGIWEYRTDSARIEYFYSQHGPDSTLHFSWDGNNLNLIYRQYFNYNPNDTLIRIQYELYDSIQWVTDTITIVTYPVNLPGISRIDTAYSDSLYNPDEFRILYYDSLNRLSSLEDYNYGYIIGNNEHYIYDCNRVSEYHQAWAGTHDGSFAYLYFDSLCTLISEMYGHYAQSSGSYTVADYYYVGCSTQVVLAGSDLKICQGDSTDISAMHFGGMAPFNYEWSPAQGLLSDSTIHTKAFPDSTTNYIIKVTDANGLVMRDTIKVVVSFPPIANITIATIDTVSVCQSAVLSADSSLQYQFAWYRNGVYTAFYSHLNITYNGLYVVYVGVAGNSVCPDDIDSLNFNYFTSVPPSLTLSRSCHEIYAAPSVPSTIQWFYNNQLIVDSIRDTLTVSQNGNYSAVITDSLGCMSPAVQLNYTYISESSASHSTCANNCNGYIEVHPYYGCTFVWSNGNSTATAQNLCSGIYSVLVTDQYGCTASLTDTVDVFPDINLNYITTGTSSPSACDAIVIPVDTGNTPYAAYYQWDNNTYGLMNDSLCAGWHTVRVSPRYSYCPQIDSFFIPSSLSNDTCSIIESHTDMSCNGYADGTITITSSTGSPFACHWFFPNVNDLLVHQIHLNSGAYSCMMIDQNGCMDTISITITEPPPLTISFNIYQSTCGDSCVLTATGSGGTPPYNYHWCDGSNGSQLTSCIEECSVFLTDSKFCFLADTVVQPSVSPIIFQTINNLPSCAACSDGSIIVIASGGVPPYSYSVDNGPPSSNDTLTNLSEGNHTVCVTGNNGCTTCDNQIILILNSLLTDKYFSVYPNPAHDRLFIKFSEYTADAPAVFVVYDMTGRKVNQFPVIAKEFEYSIRNLLPGIYMLILIESDNILVRRKIEVY